MLEVCGALLNGWLGRASGSMLQQFNRFCWPRSWRVAENCVWLWKLAFSIQSWKETTVERILLSGRTSGCQCSVSRKCWFFFYANGPIQRKFVPGGTTENNQYYLVLTERLYSRMGHVRNEKFETAGGFCCMTTRTLPARWMWSSFLASRFICVIHHPPARQIWYQKTLFSSRRWNRC